ncbi:MAG: polysaccharide biosynthesis/export family protein [Pyrinomonadaceae bacterium]|nr:polysaccharide biosynthesis/export family protein [Pyrinomonadaceae bacterium]
MNRIHLIVSVLAICCFSIAAAPALRAQQEREAAPQVSIAPGPSSTDNALDSAGAIRYQVGPSDTIDIRVFGEPQFSGPIEVDEDGNIEVPFIEKPIKVTCLTQPKIRKIIATELERYLNKPQVSVRVTAKNARAPVVVFGAVRSATRIGMQRKKRLLEVLAVAGGITEQAGGDIQVFHTTSEMCPEPGEEEMTAVIEQAALVEQKTTTTEQATEQKTTTEAEITTEQKTTDDKLQVRFDIYSLDNLKLGKDNPYIRPGDIVIVQEAKPVYITGAVNAPMGLHHRENMSLSRAIAMVGGVRPDAKKSDVRIYRQKVGSLDQEVIKVNYGAIKNKKQPDIALQPYDIVDVGATSAISPARLLQLALGAGAASVSTIGTYLPYRVLY